MAIYEITLKVDGARKESVEKALRGAFGKDIPIHSVEKLKTAESRADRLGEAEGLVTDAQSLVEELKDEIQSWRDGIPENMSSGDKAGQLDDCLSNLETLGSSLDSAAGEFGSVEFPGMY